MKLIVRAGTRARHHCPITLNCPAGSVPSGLTSSGRVIPVQRDGDRAALILPAMEAGTEQTWTPEGVVTVGGVMLEDDGKTITVHLDNRPFTAYHYANVPARPYFWPLLAPGDIEVTRGWPMRERPRDDETRDHKHHRSMWVAFGEVNGADNWSEEPGHGYTVHRSLDEIVSGPVFGRFRTTSDWTDASGRKLLTQSLTATFWAASGDAPRFVDIVVALKATEGDVHFGDTKEGGLISIRVATPMDVPRGGKIENAFGGINEPENWGHAAHWCDYSGIVDGAHVGIAVMDHPHSFRYPTYWHVRDYGLMAANPFALKAYTGGLKDGSYTLSQGDEMRFIYRVAIHRGDASQAGIRDRYLDFIVPPVAAWAE